MPSMPTINVTRPIVTAYLVPEGTDGAVKAEGLSDGSAEHGRNHRPAVPGDAAGGHPLSEDLRQDLQRQRDDLARLRTTLQEITDRLHRLHEQTVASQSAEIARLAVEIARRILRHKVGQGDYEIQAIVEEALKEAPTRQNIVVHLNPDDLALCRELQQRDSQGPLAGLELTADRGIGRGECLVETPKGIVKSFIEEHLERISEALQRAQ
jgi:flagellar biosynthesis/type III secretory pathway protein FliH